jgi:hypothetical protein
MTRGTRARARFVFGASAALGVVAAHWLAYRIVSPDPHARAELLEHSGHRFFTLLAALALGGFAVAVAGSLTSRLAGVETRARALCGIGARLALSQSAAWIVLEEAERLLAAHHHGSLFVEPVFWIGLGLQLLVAACSALLFGSIGRVVITLLARRPSKTGKRSTTGWPLARSVRQRLVRLEGTWGSRGPPAPAFGSFARRSSSAGSTPALATH